MAMAMPQNLYVHLLSSMHPKVQGYLSNLDDSGQIDRDSNMDPYLTRMEQMGPGVFRVHFLRNGYEENSLLNTRSRKMDDDGVIVPVKTTIRISDGWKRVDPERRRVVDETPSKAASGRGERAKRQIDYGKIAEALIC